MSGDRCFVQIKSVACSDRVLWRDKWKFDFIGIGQKNMALQENSWVDFDAFPGVIHKSTARLLSIHSKSGSWTLWVTPARGVHKLKIKTQPVFSGVAPI